jgi:hypothetical protein
MRLCTLHNYYAPDGNWKLMRLFTLHNYYAPVWLPETDEIMHPRDAPNGGCAPDSSCGIIL